MTEENLDKVCHHEGIPRRDALGGSSREEEEEAEFKHPEMLYGGATTEGHQVQIPKGERSGGNERK